MGNKKLNAVRFGFLLTVGYIILTSIVIGGMNVYFYIQDSKQDSRSIQKIYSRSVVNVLRERIESVVSYIDNERKLRREMFKEHLRRQVNKIYSVFYEVYFNEISRGKSQTVKKDLISIANAFHQKRKGECLIIFDGNGVTYVGKSKKDLVRMLLLKNPKANKFIMVDYKGRKKIIYVKFFKPTGWYLSYCGDLTLLENNIKKNIIAYLNKYRYGYKKHGYIFVSQLLNPKGGECFEKALVNPNRPEIVGKCLSDNVKDARGFYYRKKYLYDVVHRGYSVSTYYYKIPNTNKIGKKISYIVLYKPWNWLIGTGFYEKDIAHQFYLAKIKDLKKTVERVVLIVFVILASSAALFLFFLRKVSDEARYIMNFLSKFPEEKNIAVDKLMFEETWSIAKKVSEMAKKVIELTRKQEELISRYTTVTNHMKSCIIIARKSGDSLVIEDINRCVKKCMGLSNTDFVIGRDLRKLLKRLPAIVRKFEMVFEKDIFVESVDIISKIRNCGYRRYFLAYLFKIREDEAVYIADDITDSVMLYYKNIIERDRFASLIEDIDIGVSVVDLEGKIVFSNSKIDKIFELDGSRINGISELFLIEGERNRFNELIEGLVKGEKQCNACIFEIVTFKGNRKWIEISATEDIINNQPVLIFSIKDITEKYLKEKEIEYLSFHDDLTNLYNRRFFKEEFTRLFDKRNYPMALVIFDINGLKMVNDILGHTWGDWLIKRVAFILKSSTRAVDLLARIGGDEFVLLMTATGKSGVEKCLERIDINIQAENSKEGQPYISVSYGFAIQEGNFDDPDSFFAEADRVMYERKYGENRITELRKIWESIRKMAPERVKSHKFEEFYKR